MASKQKIAVMVAMLCEAFGRKPTPATFMAYEIGLADVTDDALELAVRNALAATGDFMPTPGALRAIARTNGVGYDAQADRAWAVLCNAIDRFGSGRSVNFRDGLVNATVRQLGGWEFICGRTVEDFETWTKKDFLATYTRFLQTGCPAESTGYLPGLCERHNYGWLGNEYGAAKKPYALPATEEVGCDYEPQVISPAAEVPTLEGRPATIPLIELKKVN